MTSDTFWTSLPARFSSKIDRTEACWLWTAGKFGTGYGAYWMDGKTLLAHRVMWRLFAGDDAAELDHRCRNEACVNPAHLEPVSHAENMRRADVVLGIRSAATECPHGHAYDEANTSHRNGRRHCRTCDRARASRNYYRNKSGRQAT